MRVEVADLVKLGPLPASTAAVEEIAKHEKALGRIQPPVTDEEADALLRLFGPDDCYGLAWSLVHLIESAPHWPHKDALKAEGNEWTRRLRAAAERAGKL